MTTQNNTIRLGHYSTMSFASSPSPETYESSEIAYQLMQTFARSQGYALVKTRPSNYDDQGPRRWDVTCANGGRYESMSKGIRKAHTRKTDCPFRLKILRRRIQYGNRWGVEIMDNRHNHPPDFSLSVSRKQWHTGPDDSWHGIVSIGGRFAAERLRYHLYIGLFCPFAHRVSLIHALAGLKDIVPVTVVKPFPKGDDKGWPGWEFAGCRGDGDVYPGAEKDPIFGSRYLHDLYFRADPNYKGRYSVPLLWDRKENTIVSNESLELIRWLPTAFSALLPPDSPHRQLDLYPEHLKERIDEVKKWLAPDFNSGVYKAGFAPDQEAYNKNLPPVFAALNQLEALIHKNGGPFVLGKELTELDLLAYPTAIRFDVIYVQHFKCNLGTIRADYPVIHEWMKNLYWNVKGFQETTNFQHIKDNYAKSQPKINSLAITPMGPFPDIKEGVDLDFASLEPGSIDHPAVVEHQKTLPGI